MARYGRIAIRKPITVDVNWTAVAAVATAFSALATATAAAFTASMAHRTRQAVDQTKDLISAAKTQATAGMTQAEEAKKQVVLAQAQVQATEAAMVAMHTPVLAPSFFGGLSKERSLGALSATLPGGEILDLRFSSLDVSGHVQSCVRSERRRHDLAFICCLRNVGLGPAVVEGAQLLIAQRKHNLFTMPGHADNAPIINDRVLVSFRLREARKMRLSEYEEFVAGLAGADSRISLSLRYRSPSSGELGSTTASYRCSIISSDPFDVVGALSVESFETAGTRPSA